jgi:hypothetical protein
MNIEESIIEIMKHISVLNDDYTKMSVSLAILTERVEWLCKFFWVVVTAKSKEDTSRNNRRCKRRQI